ncbi:alpha/beta fold hydrolase [Rhodococcus sp. WMMA185]|uniref:alpha/beta fold hydrolase n=1 Tax=Rhodococcus sp. WMMA185 TaxID=679318 RepID=UPI001E57F578|nr:alpha/beta hydrolase [Rhodococcus sp. WMMA185]
MHVVVDGKGPPVVLYGGLGGNWFDWDGVAAQLSRDHRVVRIDRPGYGLSPTSNEPPTVQGEAQRIRAVLAQLAITEPAIVVGHSLGGIYAEAFARLYPRQTSAVLLLDATVPKRRRLLVPTRWRVETGRRIAHAASLAGLQHALGPGVYRLLNHSKPPDGIPPPMQAWIDRVVREPAYLEASIVENASYPELVHQLLDLREGTMLTAPVVVAAADSASRTPWGWVWIRTQQRFAEALGADFRVVRPAKHHAMIDQPDQIAALVRGLSG